MSVVVPFSRWRYSLECQSCEEGEVCLCTDDIKKRVWSLAGTTGAVQQFHDDGPYYGTWDGVRTGAMETLDACKRRVERAVCHD